ncbi:GNAT family N-acetyltransferase [Mycobacterium intracellulare]|uniref:GNAT family N-acetyltransferase n=1 Tax=Mycobacterium intracellulare TaxID=1767 RepID=UPI000C7B5E7F|nr:GNAT family N-acetyltransferase [Mycobacterium intracellulare]
MEIRRARSFDASNVAALLTELGYPASPTEVTDRLGRLDRSDCVLITAGGLIALHRVPRLAEGSPFARITALVVTADRRGQGIGNALLNAAEDVARDWDCSLIEVSSARRNDRDRAHSFYAKSGFEDTGERSVRYWKTLRQS